MNILKAMKRSSSAPHARGPGATLGARLEGESVTPRARG